MAGLRVEIVYPLAHAQTILRLTLAPGATVKDAVERAGILRLLPPGVRPSYGIFGRRVAVNHPVTDGDRIEIYRRLAVDPRVARRARAKPARPTRR